MLFAGAAMRRECRRQADLIQAVAIGYGGCKSKQGAKAMQSAMQSLRK